MCFANLICLFEMCRFDAGVLVGCNCCMVLIVLHVVGLPFGVGLLAV